MNASKSQNELLDLFDSLLGGAIAPSEHERLQKLLADDPVARRIYFDYLDMHLHLRQWQKAEAAAEQRDERQGMAGSPAIDGEAGFGIRDSGFKVRDLSLLVRQLNCRQAPNPEPRTPNPEPRTPNPQSRRSSSIFPPLSPLPSPLSPDFVGSWAFSCMVSAVFVCVMLLVFWAIEITPHQHIAEAPSQSVPSDVRPEMVFVGRITGMVDVKWLDDPRYMPPPDFAHVPLDRKYILDSGLLEITYDSGAKVILQGPCTYEVESTAGGYLALGKLTARIGERGEGRGKNILTISNQQS